MKLGPRSFDLLLLLVQRSGEFLSNEELLSTVWAGLVVEEGSVRVHMVTLRKALGEPGEATAARSGFPTFRCGAIGLTDAFSAKSWLPLRLDPRPRHGPRCQGTTCRIS